MDTLLSILLPLMPIIINVICIFCKGGKIISLIASLVGMAGVSLLMILNSGYGIGFGNPWIGVDWVFSLIYLTYAVILLVTHAFVPSSGIVKTISTIFLVLAGGCLLLILGLQILNTIEH